MIRERLGVDSAPGEFDARPRMHKPIDLAPLECRRRNRFIKGGTFDQEVTNLAGYHAGIEETQQSEEYLCKHLRNHANSVPLSRWTTARIDGGSYSGPLNP
jgi:hypothetical protein